MVMARRLLTVGGGGASFTPPAQDQLVGLYNGSNDGSLYAIGAATFDGVTWTRDATNPVLEVGAGGAWDDATVKDPWLLHDGSQYIVYYAGLDGTNYRIGRATSADLVSWTKYASNPIVGLGAGGSFDDVHAIFPAVVRVTSNDWRMWYTGFDGARWHIGYADSTDGLAWTKQGQVLTVGTAGAWDDEGVVVGAILVDGSTGILYYGGTSDPDGNFGWQGGAATFDWDDPTGAYTKSASNPVIPNRNSVDPDSSQPLDVTIGSTNATVTDTSYYSVGEPIVLADADSETQVTVVDAIPDATHVTLRDAASATFSTAAGARLRPLTYLSVQPRTVRAAAGGGYEAFVTAFQPVADLSVGGSPLREGSLRATASAPEGPWAWDYDTGLIFPLDNASWDGRSAENMSVIPEP